MSQKEQYIEQIRSYWNDNKDDKIFQDRLNATDFLKQEQQAFAKAWLNNPFPNDKLKFWTSIKDPKKYSDKDFDEFCIESNLNDNEKETLQKIVENFGKRDNQVVSLDNYARKVPLAYSLCKYKLDGNAGDASKRSFEYYLNPQTQFPATKSKVDEVCGKLECDHSDEALLSFMKGLNLEGASCQNADNQTSLYWEILWGVFYISKDVWICGGAWEGDSYIKKFYAENYWEGGPGDSPTQMKCLQSVKMGDLIALKTRKGAYIKDTVPDLNVLYLGVAIEDSKANNSENKWFSFKVKWFENFPGHVYEGMYKKPYNGTIGKCAEKNIIKDLNEFAIKGTFKMIEEKKYGQ